MTDPAPEIAAKREEVKMNRMQQALKDACLEVMRDNKYYPFLSDQTATAWAKALEDALIRMGYCIAPFDFVMPIGESIERK